MPPKLRRIALLAGVALLALGTARLCRESGPRGRSRAARPDCLVLGPHGSWVQALAFSPDGSLLASGSGEGGTRGEARLWVAETGLPVLDLGEQPAGVYAVAFAPDGQTLVTGGWEPAVRSWGVPLGECRGVAVGPPGRVAAVTFPPGGRAPVVLSHNPAPGRFVVWDAATGRDLAVWNGPTIGAFSADGRLVTAVEYLTPGGEPARAHIREVGGGESSLTLAVEPPVLSVAAAPDGRTLAIGGDGAVTLWDLGTGEVRARVQAQLGEYTKVSAAAFSPDGRLLATAGDDRAVHVWDAATARMLAVLHGHTGAVYALAFSPDGRRLASGGFDKCVRVWNLAPVATRGGPK